MTEKVNKHQGGLKKRELLGLPKKELTCSFTDANLLCATLPIVLSLRAAVGSMTSVMLMMINAIILNIILALIAISKVLKGMT